MLCWVYWCDEALWIHALLDRPAPEPEPAPQHNICCICFVVVLVLVLVCAGVQEHQTHTHGPTQACLQILTGCPGSSVVGRRWFRSLLSFVVTHTDRCEFCVWRVMTWSFCHTSRDAVSLCDWVHMDRSDHDICWCDQQATPSTSPERQVTLPPPRHLSSSLSTGLASVMRL